MNLHQKLYYSTLIEMKYVSKKRHINVKRNPQTFDFSQYRELAILLDVISFLQVAHVCWVI